MTINAAQTTLRAELALVEHQIERRERFGDPQRELPSLRVKAKRIRERLEAVTP